MDHILSYRDPRKRQEALDTVPCNLIDAYKDIMDRINKGEKDDLALGLRILSWLFYAPRPLLMSELQEVLSVRRGDRGIIEDFLLDPQDIIECCKRMVVYEEEGGVVRFAHHTVRHFLQSECVPFLLTRVDLGTTCLIYLLFDIFGKGACFEQETWNCRLNSLKFCEFAAKYWGYYLQGDGEESESVRKDIFQLIDSKPKSESMLQLHFYSPGCYRFDNFPKGRTGLHILASQGLAKILKMALCNARGNLVNEFCKYFDLNEWTGEFSNVFGMIKDTDETGHTAFHLATRNGHTECTKILLEAGSTGTERTKTDWTPLHMASRYGQTSIVRLLLENGVDPSSTDLYGWSPLHIAARYGYKDVVKTLLEVGVNVNEHLFKAKATALHLAARYGRREVVELLLEKGARVETQEKRGFTALHLAARNGHRPIVENLLNAGAEPNTKDNEGRTPWDMAGKKYPEIGSLLESHKI